MLLPCRLEATVVERAGLGTVRERGGDVVMHVGSSRVASVVLGAPEQSFCFLAASREQGDLAGGDEAVEADRSPRMRLDARERAGHGVHRGLRGVCTFGVTELFDDLSAGGDLDARRGAAQRQPTLRRQSGGGRCSEVQRRLPVAEVERDAGSEQRRRGRPVVVADHPLSDPRLFCEVRRLGQQAGGVRQLGSVGEHDRWRRPRRLTRRIVHQAPALGEVAGAGGDPATVVQEVRGERQLAELATTLLGVDRVGCGRFEVAHVGVREGRGSSRAWRR